MKITVKPGVEMGDGCAPFIIGEVGSNWQTFEDCKNSIALAKQCGADAVKFQAFTYDALWGPNLHHDHSKPIAGQLPLAWLPKLKEKADACGIEFMCSAFSPELVDAVDPYVSIHKVASAELTHIRILERLRAIGKPVILSTGASGEEDIARALHTLGDTPTVLLYCVASYPANEVNLATIQLLRDRFNRLTGYSDHTTDVLEIPRSAVHRWNSCVIEKHFTAIDADTPDAPHSLTVDQFRRMVVGIHGGVQPVLAPLDAERAMVSTHNRRLLATRDCAPGDTLTEGYNFGIYRSLKPDFRAYSPWIVDEINGRKAKRAIKAGDGIGPGDV